jgi:hypothetical protein
MPTEYLEVVVGHCKGYPSQSWFIKMHDGQLGLFVNSQLRPYFSIHSEAFPHKCLTKHTRSAECIRSTVFAFDFTSCREPFQGLFLADCNGCNEQSFFIDASFLDIIKNIGTTGEVNNYGTFMALASSKRPACEYTDSMDTDKKSKCKLCHYMNRSCY